MMDIQKGDFTIKVLHESCNNGVGRILVADEMKEPITPASVKNRGGDLRKRWFVEYAVLDPKTGKKVRFRETGNANRIHDRDKRYDALQEIADEINRRLNVGWSPFGISGDTGNGARLNTVQNALETIVEHKATYRAHTGHRDGLNRVSVFMKWCKQNNYHVVRPERFTSPMAYQFMDYLLITRKLAPKTYNNYLIELRSCFELMIKRGMLKNNPFSGVDKLPERSHTHRAFSMSQMQELTDHIIEKDPQLWRYCILVMHAIRPIEITRIRVRDLDMDSGTISIWSENSKTAEARKVKIMAKLMTYFSDMDAHRYPGHYFLFSAKHPSETQPSREYYTKRFKKIKKALGYTDRAYTMYGLKHTMVCHLADNGVNVGELLNFTGIKTLTALEAYLNKHLSKPVKDYSDLVPFG